MKLSPALETGILRKRYKRFLADVELPGGKVITMHCPNTGSMKNCSEPGSKVWFSQSGNPKRKYPHTLECIEVSPKAVAGINTGRANALVREAIESGRVAELSGYTAIRSEVRYGEENSRIDFLLEEHPSRPGEACYVEVKNVTLGMGQGLGLFPDAVTERGRKHLRELMEVKAAGHRAILFFCVQHSGIEGVEPADEIDPAYGATLREAVAKGVEVLAYRARMSVSEIVLEDSIPVRL